MPPFQFDDIVLNEETKPIESVGEETNTSSTVVPPTLPTLDSMAEEEYSSNSNSNSNSAQDSTQVSPESQNEPQITIPQIQENSVQENQEVSSEPESFSIPQLASLDEMPSMPDDNNSEGMIVEQAPVVPDAGSQNTV